MRERIVSLCRRVWVVGEVGGWGWVDVSISL